MGIATVMQFKEILILIRLVKENLEPTVSSRKVGSMLVGMQYVKILFRFWAN